MRIRLESPNWKQRNGVYVRGEGFVGDQFYSTSALIDYFSAVTSEEELKQRLSQLNGCFALIIDQPDMKLAAIDITRIYPIFYANVQGEWFLTDRASFIADYGTQFDNLALAQYKCSGSTFAGRTLVQGMQQLMPAYYLRFDQSLIHQISFKPYAVSIAKWGPQLNLEQSLTQLDIVLRQVMTRLLQSVGERQIVVPLSGGYDSRLLLAWLYRMEKKNVVCYTIGKENSPECIRAQKVARQLGYVCHRIDNEEFAKRENPVLSSLFTSYYRFMGGCTNFTWLFELPILLELTAKGMIEKDAVFVPGHSADFLSGSQLEKGQITPHAKPKKMAKTILLDNFEYAYPTKHGVYDEVFAYLNKCLFNGVPSYIAYNDFLMRNTIVPQINNAARIYEFFGYDVRLPYWDDAFISFFFQQPYAYLRGRKLYRTYVHRFFRECHIDFYQEEPSSYCFWIQKLKNRMKYYFPTLAASYRKRKGAERIQSNTIEGNLAQPLLKEMKEWRPTYIPHSVNELLKDWYLHQVAKGFGKAQGNE